MITLADLHAATADMKDTFRRELAHVKELHEAQFEAFERRLSTVERAQERARGNASGLVLTKRQKAAIAAATIPLALAVLDSARHLVTAWGGQ